MSPRSAERTRSYQPIGTAVELLPKYLVTREDELPYLRRWALALAARVMVSSRPREICRAKVALQDSWIGKPWEFCVVVVVVVVVVVEEEEYTGTASTAAKRPRTERTVVICILMIETGEERNGTGCLELSLSWRKASEGGLGQKLGDGEKEEKIMNTRGMRRDYLCFTDTRTYLFNFPSHLHHGV